MDQDLTSSVTCYPGRVMDRVTNSMPTSPCELRKLSWPLSLMFHIYTLDQMPPKSYNSVSCGHPPNMTYCLVGTLLINTDIWIPKKCLRRIQRVCETVSLGVVSLGTLTFFHSSSTFPNPCCALARERRMHALDTFRVLFLSLRVIRKEERGCV